MKKQNFAIIGGQYAFYCYGFTPTLTGAKRLARKKSGVLGQLAGMARSQNL